MEESVRGFKPEYKNAKNYSDFFSFFVSAS